MSPLAGAFEHINFMVTLWLFISLLIYSFSHYDFRKSMKFGCIGLFAAVCLLLAIAIILICSGVIQ